MAFSILCSIAGAILVSKLGLLHPEPAQKLEKIVFDQSDLTRFDHIAERVEAGHVAMRELKKAQEAEARRRAAAEVAEKEAAEREAADQARSRAAARAQSERKNSQIVRREAAPATSAAAPAAPLVITPVAADRGPERDGIEGVFDKLASGVSKLRDFVVNAVRIEKPANLPFGGPSASADSLNVIDDLRGRLKLPSFEM
jgi:hypothetical protein